MSLNTLTDTFTPVSYLHSLAITTVSSIEKEDKIYGGVNFMSVERSIVSVRNDR